MSGASRRQKTVRGVAVLNFSSTLLTAEVLNALQVQLDNHFFPFWGCTATLHSISSVNELTKEDYLCLLSDETDRIGCYGYHDIDNRFQPYCKVFADTAKHAGREFTVVMSHEIMEMLADPWGNRVVLYKYGENQGALYALQVCDPVQVNTYSIDSVLVSDFVTPNNFIVGSPKPYDYLNVLENPFSTAPYGSQLTTLVGQVGART